MSLPTDRQEGDVIENEDINAIASEVNRVANDVGQRAHAGHGHAIDDVQGLGERLLALESDSGTSVPGVPIFESLAEAQAWEVDNPGVSAYYVTVDDGLTHVVAASPTFTDEDDTANDTYTIPTSLGVIYKTGATVRAAGTYPGSGTVTVTADPESGYAIDGTRSWTFTFTTGTAPGQVTPPTPTANDTTDRVTIPDVTGVTYKVDGVDAPPPYYEVGNVDTTVTVTAHAQPGYALTGTTSWTFTFTESIAQYPAGVLSAWAGASLGEVNTTPTSWTDDVGSHDLTIASVQAKVAQEPGGDKYLKLDNYGLTGTTNVSGDLTYAIQYRIRKLPPTGGPRIMGTTGGNDARAYVNAPATDPKLGFRAHGSYTTTVPALADSMWHTLIVTHVTGGIVRIYFDGVLVHEQTGTTTIGANTAMHIGDTVNDYWTDIAYAAIWDRSFTEAEAVGFSAEMMRLTGYGT